MRRRIPLHPSLRLLPILFAIAALTLSCGRGADEPEATDDAAADAAPSGHIVATFLAPDLDEVGTKALITALAENPGILTAAALPDSGLFVVAFTGETTSPAEVLGAVSKTNPRLALRDIAQVAGGGGKDPCGGCPSQATCAGATGK